MLYYHLIIHLHGSLHCTDNCYGLRLLIADMRLACICQFLYLHKIPQYFDILLTYFTIETTTPPSKRLRPRLSQFKATEAKARRQSCSLPSRRAHSSPRIWPSSTRSEKKTKLLPRDKRRPSNENYEFQRNSSVNLPA